jgi:hypothetical protein
MHCEALSTPLRPLESVYLIVAMLADPALLPASSCLADFSVSGRTADHDPPESSSTPARSNFWCIFLPRHIMVNQTVRVA